MPCLCVPVLGASISETVLVTYICLNHDEKDLKDWLDLFVGNTVSGASISETVLVTYICLNHDEKDLKDWYDFF